MAEISEVPLGPSYSSHGLGGSGDYVTISGLPAKLRPKDQLRKTSSIAHYWDLPPVVCWRRSEIIRPVANDALDYIDKTAGVRRSDWSPGAPARVLDSDWCPRDRASVKQNGGALEQPAHRRINIRINGISTWSQI